MLTEHVLCLTYTDVLDDDEVCDDDNDGLSITELCDGARGRKLSFSPPLPQTKNITISVIHYPQRYKKNRKRNRKIQCINNEWSIVEGIVKLYESMNLEEWGDAEGSDFEFKSLRAKRVGNTDKIIYEIEGNLIE